MAPVSMIQFVFAKADLFTTLAVKIVEFGIKKDDEQKALLEKLLR